VPINYIPIYAAIKLPSGEIEIREFTDLRSPDKLITNRSNLILKDCEILELGVGSIFLEKYNRKYNKE
jgi:hypothetical protein